jgi:hypothetical protein
MMRQLGVCLVVGIPAGADGSRASCSSVLRGIMTVAFAWAEDWFSQKTSTLFSLKQIDIEMRSITFMYYEVHILML